jgi:hypothetical protein
VDARAQIVNGSLVLLRIGHAAGLQKIGILVPDPVFVNSGGYAAFRAPSSVLPWRLRRDTVLWRGTSTGIGQVTTETMAAGDPHLRQRIRVCFMPPGRAPIFECFA